MNGAARAPPGSAPIFWTPRVLVLAGGGAAFGVAAIVLRSSIPLFFALPLLLAPIAAGLFVPRRALVARVEWTERGTGTRVRIAGRITTDPPVAPSLLYPRFKAPAPLFERAAPDLEVLEPTLAFALEYETPFPCIVDVPLPEIVWRDPLGLAESPVTVTGSPLALERYPPELHRIGVVNLRRTTPLPGEIRSHALGAAGDFFAVRTAQPTDTPRQINWPATARAGRLIANDYLVERTGDLVVLLDGRPSELGPGRDEQLLSVARAGALGIATAFLQAKSRVGLAVFGEFLEAVPLGTGRRQRFRVRRLLGSATISSESGPAERCAISLRQYFPPGVLTLLISPLAGEEQTHLLPHLRRRGYPVIVLSPSPVPVLVPPAQEDSREDALARRFLRLERRERLGSVWGEAPAVDWEDYWSLAPLVALLRRPAGRGIGR